MTRKQRLKKIKAIRKFRDKALSIKNVGELTHHLINSEFVSSVTTQYGWTTITTVILSDGSGYMGPDNDLKGVIKFVYAYAISTINATKKP